MTATTNTRKKTTKAPAPKASQPVEKEQVQVKKKYEKDDLILCKSLFEGEVILIGRRTKQDYHFTQLGEEVEVEYQDINAEIISGRSDYVYAPLLLIMDEELVASKPKLKALYEKLVPIEEIQEVIDAEDTDVLRQLVKKMPQGQIDLTKNLIASRIADGLLGNIRTVKSFDRILGTEFATQLEMIA